MKLIIIYKNGSDDIISDFESVSYVSNGSRKTLTDDLSTFSIADGRTYNFKGSYQLSVNGSEIKTIALVNDYKFFQSSTVQ